MQKEQHKRVNHKRFQLGDKIYLKKNTVGVNYKIEPGYSGPFEITEERHGNKFMIKEIETGIIKLAHADKMKLFSWEINQKNIESVNNSKDADQQENNNIRSDNQSKSESVSETTQRRSPRLVNKTINYEEV